MGAYSFTERSPLETGFAEVFERQIVPILERAETERRELRRKALLGMGAAGSIGATGLGTGLALEAEAAGITTGILGGVGTLGARAFFQTRWKRNLSKEIVPILCEFLGGMRPSPVSRIDIGAFVELGVVPSHHQAVTEDPVEGRHTELDWALTEALLIKRVRRRRRTSKRTVFRGLLFQIAVDEPAPRIFFARDRGAVLNWLSERVSDARGGMERVEVGQPEFERVYEVYSDDPAAARAYVTPGLVEGLMLVAEHEGRGGYVGCAFEGDWFRIALPRRDNFLSLGSLFRPTHDIGEDLHRALWDLDMPRRVIDALTGR